MKIIILAGGCGSRLWPYSKSDFPKQFLDFGDGRSFLQKTILRFQKALFVDEILIVTSSDYAHITQKQIKELKCKKKINILVEPYQKNTAPAIALAMRYLKDKFGVSNSTKILTIPSDHLIVEEDQFLEKLDKLNALKLDKILTFGIKPSRPDVGYGYILKGEKINDLVFQIDKFIEKPNLSEAKRYLLSQDYFWNAGMFLFTEDLLFEELKKHAKDIYTLSMGSYLKMFNSFKKMPNISIDYAIMEKSKNIALFPLDITWSDIGSWDSVYDVLEKDENENVKIGNVLDIDTKNSLIIGKKRLISTIGLTDMLIVETEEAIFLAKKGQSQKIKELIKQLKEKAEIKK